MITCSGSRSSRVMWRRTRRSVSRTTDTRAPLTGAVFLAADHLRHLEERAVAVGGVLQGLFQRQRVAGDVGAEDVLHVDRVGHRLDTAHVGLAQLVDVAEARLKLRGEARERRVLE